MASFVLVSTCIVTRSTSMVLALVVCMGMVAGCGDDPSDAPDSEGHTGEASTAAQGSTGSVSEPTSTTETSSSTGGTTAVGSSTGAFTTRTDTSSTGEPSSGCDRDHAYDLPLTPLEASQTDPEITDVYDHLYLEPDGSPADLLFVFLPGTGGPPAGYQQILQNAAAGGYHAIGLSYVNAIAVNDVCTVLEPGCHEGVRNEVITGEDSSELVEVSPADSIEHRLVAALNHLGWDQYVVEGAPAWNAIAVAGHSQGAGHAAFIARDHEVHRALLFAGTEPADWTQDPLATPLDRLWGFVHVDDGVATPAQASWDNLGIPGPLFDVDGQPPPFGDSHQLQTALRDDGGNAHGSIVVDIYTPQDGGLPVYRDVWCTMIGP